MANDPILSMMSFNKVTINLSIAQLDYLRDNFFEQLGIFDLNEHTAQLVYEPLVMNYEYYRLIDAKPLQSFAYEILSVLEEFVPNKKIAWELGEEYYQKEKKAEEERKAKELAEQLKKEQQNASTNNDTNTNKGIDN